MSESTLSAFESYLDQTLASLPVRAGRRREMRDELLAHLLCVFDDELARQGDERAALTETMRRFGAADFLHTELESAIPAWERGLSWILGQKENIMWRLFLVLGAIAVLVGLGFVMPAVQQIVYHEIVTLSVVLLLFGAAICGAGVWSFVHGIQRFRVRNV